MLRKWIRYHAHAAGSVGQFVEDGLLYGLGGCLERGAAVEFQLALGVACHMHVAKAARASNSRTATRRCW